MKNILKTILLTSILFGLAGFVSGCSSPTNTTPSNTTTNNSEDTSTQTTEQTTEQTDFKRKNCSITLPSTATIITNITGGFYTSSLSNCFATDTYKINIKSNPQNLQVTKEFIYNESSVRLFCVNTGTITITLYNETAKVESNLCTVTFTTNNPNENGNNGSENNSSSNSSSSSSSSSSSGGSSSGGNNGTNTGITASSFVGTWTTTRNDLLLDTIVFNSNGTGQCYKTGYSGNNTFTWSIQNATTLNFVNTTQNINSSSTCTYSFNGTSLILTNLFGTPSNTPITFTKN